MSDGTEDDQVRNCPTCGAGWSFQIPVWEDVEDGRDGTDPDFIGCTECHTMREVSGHE